MWHGFVTKMLMLVVVRSAPLSLFSLCMRYHSTAPLFFLYSKKFEQIILQNI